MNLRTGATTVLGSIYTRSTGTPVGIRSLAVASPGVFRFTTGPTAVSEQETSLSVHVERINGTNGPLWLTCDHQPVSAEHPQDYGLVLPRLVMFGVRRRHRAVEHLVPGGRGDRAVLRNVRAHCESGGG